MADRKVLEIIASGGDEGSNKPPGTSLVPTDQSLVVQEYGKLMDSQQAEYAEFLRFLHEQWEEYYEFLKDRHRKNEEDIIEGSFYYERGGPPSTPDDPFDWMDDGGDDEPYDPDVWKQLIGDFETTIEDLEADFEELPLPEFGEEVEDLLTPMQMLGIGFVGLATAAFAFNRAVNEMVEAVGGFSAEVVLASTRSRIQEIEDRMRLGAEAGDEIATLENIRSDLASEIRGIMREGIEAFAPIAALIGNTLLFIASIIRGLLTILSTFVEGIIGFFNVIIDFLPGARTAVDAINSLPTMIRRLLDSGEHKEINTITDAVMEDIFGIATSIEFDIEDIRRNIDNGPPTNRPATPAPASDVMDGAAFPMM